MAGLLVNPVFLARFFKDYGGAEGSSASINPSITGITVACLQLSAAVGSIVAGRLGDIIGRKRCVTIGGFIYFVTAFIQAFAPDLSAFIAGRTSGSRCRFPLYHCPRHSDRDSGATSTGPHGWC